MKIDYTLTINNLPTVGLSDINESAASDPRSTARFLLDLGGPVIILHELGPFGVPIGCLIPYSQFESISKRLRELEGQISGLGMLCRPLIQEITTHISETADKMKACD